eukprot:NODE_3525_length_961_cov_26.441886_g3237_i0.p1 GENE.NODE_3525_length_961_cov_26.441886_g3237_i0~~NODE_3525_length_961_cov_26.441886_g3237_i0.p1  ORF type:complete len:267 (-),score=36.57 NODE_3525_length_961_cov_26.441886_g3237_i0:32-832(-)
MHNFHHHSVHHRILVRYLGNAEYGRCLALQQSLLARRIAGTIPDTLLLVQHDPPVFTMGKRERGRDVLWSKQQCFERGVEVHKIDRGGEMTWHGSGQIVGYPIFNAQSLYERQRSTRAVHQQAAGQPSRQPFVPWWVDRINSAMISTAVAHGVDCGLTEDVGVWAGPLRDRKIGAVGIQLSKGCSMHGFALNVCPDLRFYEGIVPCGLPTKGVSSLAAELTEHPGSGTYDHPSAISVALVLPTLVSSFAAEFGSEVLYEANSNHWN